MALYTHDAFQFYSSAAAEALAMRKLYWYATLVVLTHAVVVLWHLELLAKFGSALKPEQVPLFAILANLIPLVAVILLWAHFPKVGA
jgi:hypothetical protein